MWQQRLWVYVRLGVLLGLVAGPAAVTRAEEPRRPERPVRALLVTGGCCHDYARQKELLKRGIESRVMVEVTLRHSTDTSTKARFEMYASPDWADGYDVVIHDECSADVTEIPYVENILAAHRKGVAAVNLHCAMHSYRTGRDDWFQFVGIHSTGHGPQQPIDVIYVDRQHPVLQGLDNWTTVNEELYNNVRLFETTKPLARGRQQVGDRLEDVVVAWANTYGKSRVFSTTLGHNNQTVGDARYLDLVSRGLLWSVDKLNAEHLQPFAKPQTVRVPVNLARGKATRASASQAGHPPEHAVDGNPETRWCSPDASPGQTWQVDLGEPSKLTGCQVTWEMDDTNYRYKVEGSTDGQTWRVLSDQTETKLAEQVQTLKFSAEGIRHVRLAITGLVPGRWGSFFEVEVHGTEFEERVVSASDLLQPKTVKGPGVPAGLKAPAGFGVTLFAAPPQISYPVCLASDLDGTVYVGVDLNGSLDKQAGRGKVVRCRDTNGDGSADEFLDFATIDSPRGLLPVPGAGGKGTDLYVLHPPHLSVYRDRTGDGVADDSEVLVRNLGFDLGFRGADHTTNGIQWGIDGWIYVAVGDYGFIEATGSDGRKLAYRGGGIVRVRPDGTGLEVVSRGQRNIYDVAVSPRLDLFTRDNTNDGGGWNVRLSHVPHGAQMGYPSLFLNFGHEIIAPLADYGGGSPCGSLYVDEPALPGELHETLLTCDWGRSIVYRHSLERRGAGFVAGQEPFLEVPRPTDIDIDAQGAMYVASWKDGGFNYGNPNVGYVLKVTPPPSAAAQHRLASLTSAPTEDLLRGLASGSHVRRLASQRELLRRGGSDAVPGLRELIASKGPLTSRIAGLFTLKQLLGVESHALLSQWATDPQLGEYALRALADRQDELSKVTIEPFLLGLTSGDARVRLQAVRGLGRFASPGPGLPVSAVRAMLPLVQDTDPVVAHVAIDSLVQLGPQAVEPCLSAFNSEQVALHEGAGRVLQALHLPAVVDGLEAWLGRGTKAAASEQGLATHLIVLRTLCRLHMTEGPYTGDWWGTRPDTSGPYYKPVGWSESDRIARILQRQLEESEVQVVQGLLPLLRRHKLELPGLQEQVVKLANADRSFFDTAVGLLAPGGGPLSPGAAELLETAATLEAGEVGRRLAALEALQRRVDQPGMFTRAFRAFSAIQENEKSADLARVWGEFVREPRLAGQVPQLAEPAVSGSASERELAYAALAFVTESPQAPREARENALRGVERAWGDRDHTRALLRGLGRSRVESQVLQIVALQKSEDPGVSDAARFAATRLELDQETAPRPGEPTVGGMKLPDLLAQLEGRAGDVKVGRRLFTRQGCVACHAVATNEPVKGPLLLDIAKRYKRAELAESIVQPSAKIAQGFESQYFATDDGKIHEGFVTRESGDEVELRNVAGAATVLRKEQIEERGRREMSVMPVGLIDRLTVEQFAGLLAYLESLKN
ncbi:MAG: ThuA domain-containing protein [Planctomycetaceae bacterium]